MEYRRRAASARRPSISETASKLLVISLTPPSIHPWIVASASGNKYSTWLPGFCSIYEDYVIRPFNPAFGAATPLDAISRSKWSPEPAAG
jgi:hypothetical protein